MPEEPYGMELILDVHGCSSRIKKRQIKYFLNTLCKNIDMEPCKLVWWMDRWYTPWWLREKDPQKAGITAVQFIIFSNITFHWLSKLNQIYLNIFSCRPFDPDFVTRSVRRWFCGEIVQKQVLERK